MPLRRRLVPLLCAIVATPAFATTTNASPPSLFGELLGIVLPLAFIILGLLVVLKLARRRYGLTGHDAPLSVVQVLAVGPRERIVLVRTRAGRVLAVGVGAQSVTFLTDLETEDVAPAPPDQDTSAGRLDTVAGR